MPKRKHDRSILEAALIGFRHQLAAVEASIADVTRQLGRKMTLPGVAPQEKPAKKRKKRSRLSAEARARISAAQKKRWAAARKEKNG